MSDFDTVGQSPSAEYVYLLVHVESVFIGEGLRSAIVTIYPIKTYYVPFC